MTIATPETAPPTHAEICETMLSVLRRRSTPEVAAQHADRNHELKNNLTTLMRDADWPHDMAIEAIDYALTHGTTLRQAMYACQTG